MEITIQIPRSLPSELCRIPCSFESEGETETNLNLNMVTSQLVLHQYLLRYPKRALARVLDELGTKTPHQSTTLRTSEVLGMYRWSSSHPHNRHHILLHRTHTPRTQLASNFCCGEPTTTNERTDLNFLSSSTTTHNLNPTNLQPSATTTDNTYPDRC